MSGEYEFDVTNGNNRGHVIGHIPCREAGREFFMSVRMHRWLGPTTPVPPME